MCITSQITLLLCYGVRVQSLFGQYWDCAAGFTKLPETASAADLAMHRAVMHPGLANGLV